MFVCLFVIASVYRQYFPADYQILQEIEVMEGTTAATENLKDGGEKGQLSLVSPPMKSDKKKRSGPSSEKKDEKAANNGEEKNKEKS